MFKKSIPLILIIVFITGLANANKLGDPGSYGSGPDQGAESGLVRNTAGRVNLLTGQSTCHIPLLVVRSKSGFDMSVDLDYVGSIEQDASKDNTAAPTGWMGLGWNTGYSSIYVIHGGTVDIADDKWFYRSSTGVVCQIISITSGTSTTYMVKSNPYWKITPHVNQPAQTDKAIIDGWTVIKEDGSILRYGDFDAATQNAGRYILCYGNYFAPTGTGTMRKFYYQWDLNDAQDVNGSKISFTYQQFIRTASTRSYTGEAYIQCVQNDRGDKIYFDLGDKSADECSKPDYPFDFHESKYLKSVRYVAKNSTVLEQVNFSYSGDVGQRPHLNGALWYNNTSHRITWYGNIAAHVKLEYHDGIYWKTIVSNMTNSGSYDWNIPRDVFSAAGCKIRVSSTDDPNVNRTMDGVFFIRKNHGFVRKFIAKVIQ